MKAAWEEEIAANDAAEKYSTFSIDTTNIRNEYSNVQNVMQQYWWPLELGYTDPVEGLAEFQKMMEAAGIEVVREEIQRQLDEFTASLSE